MVLERAMNYKKIEVIDYDDLKEMVNQEAVTRF